MIDMIVAYDNKFGLGYNDSIPWKFKYDLRHFSKISKSKLGTQIQNKSKIPKQNVLIMGRKTFESLPDVLTDRFHIVLSSNADDLNRKNLNKSNFFFKKSISDILLKIYR